MVDVPVSRTTYPNSSCGASRETTRSLTTDVHHRSFATRKHMAMAPSAPPQLTHDRNNCINSTCQPQRFPSFANQYSTSPPGSNPSSARAAHRPAQFWSLLLFTKRYCLEERSHRRTRDELDRMVARRPCPGCSRLRRRTRMMPTRSTTSARPGAEMTGQRLLDPDQPSPGTVRELAPSRPCGSEVTARNYMRALTDYIELASTCTSFHCITQECTSVISQHNSDRLLTDDSVVILPRFLSTCSVPAHARRSTDASPRNPTSVVADSQASENATHRADNPSPRAHVALRRPVRSFQVPLDKLPHSQPSSLIAVFLPTLAR